MRPADVRSSDGWRLADVPADHPGREVGRAHGLGRRALVSDGSLVLAAPMSLTGRYGHQGQLAAAGLQQAVEDVSHHGGVRVGGRTLIPEVVILDDGGTRAGVRHALDVLARADLVIGPYGSNLVVKAARWAGERARVLWNHGGSADDTQRLPGVVSVPAPASQYFAPVLDAVSGQMPGARVLVAAGRGAFGSSTADGAVSAAGLWVPRMPSKGFTLPVRIRG
jgi:ABC-type branched-subunit amino acid transport system substrate-binding protein